MNVGSERNALSPIPDAVAEATGLAVRHIRLNQPAVLQSQQQPVGLKDPKSQYDSKKRFKYFHILILFPFLKIDY